MPKTAREVIRHAYQRIRDAPMLPNSENKVCGKLKEE